MHVTVVTVLGWNLSRIFLGLNLRIEEQNCFSALVAKKFICFKQRHCWIVFVGYDFVTHYMEKCSRNR